MATKKTAAPKAPARPTKAEPAEKAAPKTKQSSPLSVMKAKFGDKAKLVEAVKKFTTEELWVGRLNSDRDGDKGLERVSNQKLLRLHATFTAVVEKFGSRAKLIDAILELEKRSKDEGYKKRISEFPVPRLFDLYKGAQRRAKNAGGPQGVAGAAK